jgi:hypothetical protein
MEIMFTLPEKSFMGPYLSKPVLVVAHSWTSYNALFPL